MLLVLKEHLCFPIFYIYIYILYITEHKEPLIVVLKMLYLQNVDQGVGTVKCSQYFSWREC